MPATGREGGIRRPLYMNSMTVVAMCFPGAEMGVAAELCCVSGLWCMDAWDGRHFVYAVGWMDMTLGIECRVEQPRCMSIPSPCVCRVHSTVWLYIFVMMMTMVLHLLLLL
ncbi:hypothetical protein V8C26DRAFT_393937 [Trichoderma gracile]